MTLTEHLLIQFPEGCLSCSCKCGLGQAKSLRCLWRTRRAVVIVMAEKHSMNGRNLEDTKKLITLTLETALATSDLGRNPLGQILCVFDLTGRHSLPLPHRPTLL